MLAEQPKGKEFKYRIMADKKSGEGSTSNTMITVM